MSAREAVIASLAAVAPDADLEAIDPTAELRDQLDLDSLDFVALVTGVHDRTGVDVPERDFPRVLTLDDLVAYVEAYLEG